MSEVSNPHDPCETVMIEQVQLGLISLTLLDKRVNLSDSDNVSQHVTQPLGVHEVKIFQEGVFIMQQSSIVVEKSYSLL